MMRPEPKIPRPSEFDAYARAQIESAGDDPQARRRVTSRLAVAVIRRYQREMNARLDRVLSLFGEMERGATDPNEVPPLVRTYDDVCRAVDNDCEFFPDEKSDSSNRRACPCAVCAADRASGDRFGTELKIEELFELAVMVSSDMYNDYSSGQCAPHSPLESIYFLTECKQVRDPSFWERVYAGALSDLRGKS